MGLYPRSASAIVRTPQPEKRRSPSRCLTQAAAFAGSAIPLHSRVSRRDVTAEDEIDNLRAWLTTVVGRVCLNLLRARKTRREVSLETHVPDPIVSPVEGIDPEREALLGDAVGLALVVILDSLTPAERVAFVLHDIFAVPFEEIAPIVGRTPTAARQLASRARRQVQDAPVPDVDREGQWAVADAFLAASRAGA